VDLFLEQQVTLEAIGSLSIFMTKKNEEVPPPWVKFPGFPPGDFFWRDAGEIWFVYVWEPFWKKLSPQEQKDYLKRYHVPYKWQRFYFDPDFQSWLEHVDDE